MVSVFSLDLMAIILIFSKHICETRHFRPAASIPMMLNPEIMNFIMCGGREEEGGGDKNLYCVSVVNLPIYFLVRDLFKSTTLATWQLGRIFNSFSDDFYIWDASSFFLQSVPSISTDYVWVVEGLLYD